MTFPLTPTVIVLGLSPADSDACTGTPLPIHFPNPGSPPFPAAAIAATRANGPRPPIPRANKPLSARALQPRLNVKRQQASATIPIVPHLPRLRSIRLL